MYDEQRSMAVVAYVVVAFLLLFGSIAAYLYFVSIPNFTINMVSGTEYSPGQEGKVMVELRDRNSDPVVANCSVTVLYPNGTTWIPAILMDPTSLGTYSYNFTISNVTGVYEYSTSCQKGAKTYIVGKAFHVSGVGLKAWITQ